MSNSDLTAFAKNADRARCYPAFGCSICWTHHAVRRVEERFGTSSDLEIPNRKIVKAHEKVADDDEFHVKTALAEFVCKRDRLGCVVILTVLFAK